MLKFVVQRKRPERDKPSVVDTSEEDRAIGQKDSEATGTKPIGPSSADGDDRGRRKGEKKSMEPTENSISSGHLLSSNIQPKEEIIRTCIEYGKQSSNQATKLTTNQETMLIQDQETKPTQDQETKDQDTKLTTIDQETKLTKDQGTKLIKDQVTKLDKEQEITDQVTKLIKDQETKLTSDPCETSSTERRQPEVRCIAGKSVQQRRIFIVFLDSFKYRQLSRMYTL